jgi:hypothetical protein
MYAGERRPDWLPDGCERFSSSATLVRRVECVMWGAATVYSGVVIAVVGLMLAIRPRRALGIPTRMRALGVVAAGSSVALFGLLRPVHQSRVIRRSTRLDAFLPAWQFREVHALRVAASPERVFDALTQVRADDIRFFRTLTWIRRAGRSLPESILNAGTREPLLDVATRSGFIWLANEAPREMVIGTVVLAPPGTRETLTPDAFLRPLPSGFALAAMNFVVTPDGLNGSVITTETRVFANSRSACRRFAMYWRVIYPGSAIIRRMWLRAIARRALRKQFPASRSQLPVSR